MLVSAALRDFGPDVCLRGHLGRLGDQFFQFHGRHRRPGRRRSSHGRFDGWVSGGPPGASDAADRRLGHGGGGARVPFLELAAGPVVHG